MEYIDNAKISIELECYKPLRRPITDKSDTDSATKKYQRKLLVRDWFFFAIWASRLKKVFKKAPEIISTRDSQLEELKRTHAGLEKWNRDRSALIAGKRPLQGGERLPTEHSGEGSEDNEVTKQKEAYLVRMKQKIEEEIAKNLEEKKKQLSVFVGIAVTGRCQHMSINIFNECNRLYPSIELSLNVLFDFAEWD